ncbi:uncharacterized protein [Lepeophtheirus salmonis]|uniref:uncharacterized protein n=1 Tax=Lepeophtheirus salmonis TaxID=72036 RepID=UPI001AE361F0|nr:uncharacterized protein LOC121125409 [Lepeophtheirus salmonis]
MKVMIENLRAKLENSGKNDLNESSSYSAQRRTFENILGSKLRNLNSGIHRVDLEDILESELKLSNNKRLEDPIPPPHASKRQAPRLHPKLTHKRPQTSIVHRPSMNLKKQIKPIQDKVNPRAVAYRSLPLIDRYQTSPWPRTMSKSNVRSLPLYQHTPGPKVHTVGFDENPITKELPLQKPAPLISSDPFPDTKELPPYHFPSARPYVRQEAVHSPPMPPYVPPMRINPPSFPSQMHHTPPQTTKIPTTLYYPITPSNFDPTKKPKTSYDKKKATMPKYVSSNSYRSNQEKKSKKLFDSHVDHPTSGTQYPMPSYNYKEPSLKFKDFGELAIAVTPKNVPHTGTTVKSYGVSSPEKSEIISLPDPRDNYFPKSLQFLSGVHSTTPNPPSPKYTTMKPPTISFTPSSFSIESTTSEYKLPQYDSHSPQVLRNVLSTTMKTPTKEYLHPVSAVTKSYQEYRSSTQHPENYGHKTTRIPQGIESPITQGYKYLKKINNIYDKYVEHSSPKDERDKQMDGSTQTELITAYQNLFSLLGFSTDFKSTFQHFMPLSNDRFKKQKQQRERQLFQDPPKRVPKGRIPAGNRGSEYPPDTEYRPSLHPPSHKKFHYKDNPEYESSAHDEYLNDDYHNVRLPIDGYKSPISNGPGKGSVIIKGDHEHPPDTQYIPPFHVDRSFSHEFFNSKMDRNLLLIDDEEMEQNEIDMMQSYLPPHIEYIHPASSRIDKTPSIKYLPPPPRTESHPHAKFILPTKEDMAKFRSYTVPSKEHGYLPPPKNMKRLVYPTQDTAALNKSNPSNILHLKDQKYYKVPSKSGQQVNDSSLNIKVNSNNDKEQHKVTIVSSGNEKTNELKHSPHSINIEINIPSNDEINLLNGDEKFHVKRKIGDMFPTSRAIVYRPHLLPIKQKDEDYKGEYPPVTYDRGPKRNLHAHNIESHISDPTESKIPLHLDPVVSRLKPPLVKELKVPRLISTLESPSLNKYGSSNETQKSFPNYLPPHERNKKFLLICYMIILLKIQWRNSRYLRKITHLEV